MAEPTGHEGKYPPTDPEGAALEPVLVEPMPTSKPEDELPAVNIEKALLHDVTKVLTQNTVTSALTSESQNFESKMVRPWYERLNPLKKGTTPVPKERTVSREYKASFLALLTFQWMTPIMKVSLIFVVNGKRIYGRS